MGESQADALGPVASACARSINELVASDQEPMRVRTPGGLFTVRWDQASSASAMGQLAFFAEFLHTSGLFDSWVHSCPLRYSSGNAPACVDVLGTWLLSILDGQQRYAHVGRLRGDGVAPPVLGMGKIVSDDSLRRALARIAPAPDAKHSPQQSQQQQEQLHRAQRWMAQHLALSTAEATAVPWILDCDATVKTLYGKQGGAVVSYNPHKRGRPSHVIHTYWIGNLRLVLDAQLLAGNRHAPKHGKARLIDLLQALPAQRRPQLVRGDSAFGTEPIMSALEELAQPYLFKLRQTAGVKRLVQRHWHGRHWQQLGQGWQGTDDELRLSGWSRKRRVIVMRRPRRDTLVLSKSKSARQGQLLFIDENEPISAYEYAVLVCNTDYGLQSIGQLYRDRADCENGFDEIKNQWGWGGYSTQDMARCALSCQAVALIYNWWSWYVRLAQPKARMEAITSRPKLLNALGRMTRHGGQNRIVLTLMHASAQEIKRLVANVRAGLQHVQQTAPQLPAQARWRTLMRYIIAKILAANGGQDRLLMASGTG